MTMQSTVTVAEPALADVARSEWLKLRSLRSTGWTIAATIVVSLGMCLLATSLYSSQWSTLSSAEREELRQDPIGLILQPGLQWGQIAICVLAVLAITGEYGTGAIRSSLLAVPTRTPLLGAKALVVALVTFGLGELIAFASFAIGAPIVSRHVPVGLGDDGVLRALLGTGVFLALTSLLALGIATIVRNTAAGITTVIALVTVVPAATSFLPGRLGEYLSTYLPGGQAGLSIMSSGHDTYLTVGPWTGLVVAAGWAAVALSLAAIALRHRDV
jgi:ABC-2 type transport system permease protein